MAAKKQDKPAAEAAEKKPRRGIGTVATEVIIAGGTNEEALAAVQKEFPDSKASLSSINWYRNKARSENPDIPTARTLKKLKAEQEGDGDPLE